MTDRRKTRARPNPRRAMAPSYGEILHRGWSRRSVLAGVMASAGAAALGAGRPAAAQAQAAALPGMARIRDAQDHWPEGYDRQVLIRWGDALFPDSPAFDPAHLTAAAAERQFGYNNDLTLFVPLGGAADRGLLLVSHEYATPYLMFPDMTAADYREKMTEEQIRVLMAATGISILEVARAGDGWQVETGSRYNRRIHMNTPIAISGPAAGDPRLCTSADPEGRLVLGTISNCNGGLTPWGTMLSGEEGAMDVFAGDYATLENQELVARQGWDEDENDEYALSRVDPRFVFESEPNEMYRFDWVVEIDPFDPEARPVKRTALGRFTHEGAHTMVAPDGRVVVFMGDDDDFEYIYRFVTRDAWTPGDRAANRDLLDHGTLSVARFGEDGRLHWIPLVAGEGPLTAEAGFASQADVVLNTRAAADLVGATPMDAPEGFVPHPQTGKLYVAMTENEDRLPAGEGDDGAQADAANPRGPNPHGHILELVPPGTDGARDFAADAYGWDVFVLCGDPAEPADGAMFHPGTTTGWFTDPDNLSVDPAGRLWVTTDGPPPPGIADAVFVMDTEGPERALPRIAYIAPVGSEACSPAFTADGTSVFISVQHPGELRMSDDEDAESIAEAGTRWPDFDPATPARPSVVVLTRRDGGMVGT
ncbi:PhoX family phosphatase [Poseidonocella sp. HB161398]|uniref:PhoX family protein n=1 Tax=Poseidonocella sp. HB161398 TaxID=2320855 RepID=UPI001107BFE6|nr:PhoX family phosphatase [Poseidonocella sp. HB161398]